MYSLVLLAAVAGGGEAPAHYFVADPCPCCVWPVFPMGGRVVFFWQGPAALSELEEKEWQEYLDALDEADKSDATYYWSRADKAGKRLLLNQVRLHRADKDKWDAMKREEEEKAKLLEEADKKKNGAKKDEKKDEKKVEKKVEKKDDKPAEKKDDKVIEKKDDKKD
jgi:hypothetical protein